MHKDPLDRWLDYNRRQQAAQWRNFPAYCAICGQPLTHNDHLIRSGSWGLHTSCTWRALTVTIWRIKTVFVELWRDWHGWRGETVAAENVESTAQCTVAHTPSPRARRRQRQQKHRRN